MSNSRSLLSFIHLDLSARLHLSTSRSLSSLSLFRWLLLISAFRVARNESWSGAKTFAVAAISLFAMLGAFSLLQLALRKSKGSSEFEEVK